MDMFRLQRRRKPKPVDKWLGAIAQLGERYNGIVEVRGSTPLGSTISPLRQFYSRMRLVMNSAQGRRACV